MMKYCSFLLLAASTTARVLMTVDGKVNPLETRITVRLTIAPKETVTYRPISDSKYILFSDCKLSFDASNFDKPQTFSIRRTRFTPFPGLNVGASIESFVVGLVGPEPNYQFCRPQSKNITLTWYPETSKSKSISCWGDPHCTSVIDNYGVNMQNRWDSWGIVYIPVNKYYYVLRNTVDDWDVIASASPWGSAAVFNRYCIRNGNRVICLDGPRSSAFTLLNPARDEYPLSAQFEGGGWQVMLPSGTTLEVQFFGNCPQNCHTSFKLNVHASDLTKQLTGLGNITDVRFKIGNYAEEMNFSKKQEVPVNIMTQLQKPNNTNGLTFTTSTAAASSEKYYTCPSLSSQELGEWFYNGRCIRKTKRDHEIDSYSQDLNKRHYEMDSYSQVLTKRDHEMDSYSQVLTKRGESFAQELPLSSNLNKRDVVANPVVSPARARQLCKEFLDNIPCSAIKSNADYIAGCALDLEITGQIQFIQASIKAFTASCESQASSSDIYDSVLKSNGFGEYQCSKNCNNRGTCEQHGCECSNSYLGFNCSVPISSVKLF